VAGAGREQTQVVLEALLQAVDRQDVEAGGGQLEGERKAVEHPTQLAHSTFGACQAEARAGLFGPLEEQAH
jgi:hypothetical protein